MKRPQQIVEYRVRRDVRENKAKDSTEHRAIGRDRGVRKTKRAAKGKEENQLSSR